jgi:hypothetical protein
MKKWTKLTLAAKDIKAGDITGFGRMIKDAYPVDGFKDITALPTDKGVRHMQQDVPMDVSRCVEVKAVPATPPEVTGSVSLEHVMQVVLARMDSLDKAEWKALEEGLIDLSERMHAKKCEAVDLALALGIDKDALWDAHNARGAKSA